jgi:adenosylmethionine-8-amino-7-oxononanoate aminotransferase
VIVIMPPLTATEEELHHVASALGSALQETLGG